MKKVASRQDERSEFVTAWERFVAWTFRTKTELKPVEIAEKFWKLGAASRREAGPARSSQFATPEYLAEMPNAGQVKPALAQPPIGPDTKKRVETYMQEHGPFGDWTEAEVMEALLEFAGTGADSGAAGTKLLLKFQMAAHCAKLDPWEAQEKLSIQALQDLMIVAQPPTSPAWVDVLEQIRQIASGEEQVGDPDDALVRIDELAKTALKK